MNRGAAAGGPKELLMSLLPNTEVEENDCDVHMDTLMDFHARLGQLSFDTIKRMSSDPPLVSD